MTLYFHSLIIVILAVYICTSAHQLHHHADFDSNIINVCIVSCGASGSRNLPGNLATLAINPSHKFIHLHLILDEYSFLFVKKYCNMETMDTLTKVFHNVTMIRYEHSTLVKDLFAGTGILDDKGKTKLALFNSFFVYDVVYMRDYRTICEQSVPMCQF